MNYGRDVFYECMIKRRIVVKDILIWLGITAASVICVYLSFILAAATSALSLSFLLTIGIIVGAYYLMTMRNLEFEYAITNGDVSVDKIINKKSRKRLVLFDCKDVQEYGDYNGNEQRLKSKPVTKVIRASINEDGTDSKYIITKTKKGDNVMILFSPDEKAQESMEPFFPQEIRFELQKQHRENKKAAN
jgi:hypothetical protein